MNISKTDGPIIRFTNPDGSSVIPVLTSPPALDEYFDKPNRITLKAEKGSAVDPRGTVRVERKGSIKLNGYIVKLDESNPAYDTIICDSAEGLLASRIAQFYRYPAGNSLNNILSEALGGQVVGLLAVANSSLPRGSWILHSGSIYKIVGAGTSSVRFGTVTSLYQNVTLLTKKASVAAMTAGSWTQDNDALYLWTTSGATPNNFYILSPNIKDTGLRLGSIEAGTASFTVAFETSATSIDPVLRALITAKGLEIEWAPQKDGTVLLNARTTVGKGSPTEPVTTFIDGGIKTPLPDVSKAEIVTSPIDGKNAQCLLAQGSGSGNYQNVAVAFDLSSPGVWIEQVCSLPSLFGSMLQGAVTKIFSTDYQEPVIYQIRTSEPDFGLGKGDYIGIIRDGYQPIVRRVKMLGYREVGDFIINAGQRFKTTAELLKGGEDVQRILSSFYNAHVPNGFSWSFPQENIDSFTGISHEFLLASTDGSAKDPQDRTLGSGEIDPAYPFQVLLNLKIGWYTSPTYSATVPTDNHGNVGGHSGYQGEGTSNAGGNPHSVNANQNQPTATAYAINGGTSFCQSSSHAHSLNVSGSWYYTSSGKDTAWGPTGGGSANMTEHAHNVTVSLTGYPVPTQYLTPAHSTNAASTHPHTTTFDPAKTRAGSAAHPQRDTVLANLKLLCATGSTKYLTLDVKVNNVEVPGSPFNGDDGAGLYIGDSINVDISNLVTVGQKNTIAYAITEFQGAGTVKCSISGGVNVSGIVSAF
jgi:hypothetical protein